MITPISPTDNTTSATRTASVQLTQNFDTFINLLTTQLRNQDPLKPMDPTEFVSQLTQFSELEQTMAQTGILEQIAGATQGTGRFEALSFLDRTVTVRSEQVMLGEGEAVFAVEMTEPIAEPTIHIFDRYDRHVATLDHDAISPDGIVRWDGRLDEGGRGADGLYRVQIVTGEGDAARIVGQAVQMAQVTQVQFGATGAILLLGNGLSVGAEAVTSVR
jgi:flagellar basal-body rod modification protein FlgD